MLGGMLGRNVNKSAFFAHECSIIEQQEQNLKESKVGRCQLLRFVIEPS